MSKASTLLNGVPTHMFFATADGSGGFENANETWNMVVPLKLNI